MRRRKLAGAIHESALLAIAGGGASTLFAQVVASGPVAGDGLMGLAAQFGLVGILIFLLDRAHQRELAGHRAQAEQAQRVLDALLSLVPSEKGKKK